MSQSARNDPEGYLRLEGEHKPYEPVTATKPEATDGDRELAASIVFLHYSASRDKLEALLSDGLAFKEDRAIAHEAGLEAIIPLIAAHVAQRVAEAVGPLEANAVRLANIVTEGGKFPYATPERQLDVVEHVFESYRRVTCNLQECVQKHHLGLGGERIDEIVVAHINSLAALVVRLKAALQKIRDYNMGTPAEGVATQALSLVPADLADCVVVHRDSLEKAGLVVKSLNRDLEAACAESDHLYAIDQLTRSNAALEAENRALRAQMLRFREALNEIENVETAWPDFSEHEQLKECIQTAKATLAPKEGK